MKLLFGFVIGAIVAAIVFALHYALINARRSDDNKSSDDNNEEYDNMFWENQMCSRCKTGKNIYELDSKSDICSNIHCWENGKCPFYVPLEEPSKPNIFKKTKAE